MSNHVILSTVKKTINVVYQIAELNGVDVTKIDSGQSQYFNYVDADFKANLIMVDSYLPEIIAFAIIDCYRNGVTMFTEVLSRLKASNPLGYNQSLGHNFYERKIRSFLSAIVLGFPHSQKSNEIVGCNVRNKDGELIYSRYRPNKFEEHVLQTAKIIIPKSARASFGGVFTNNGECFVQLTITIKFNN